MNEIIFPTEPIIGRIAYLTLLAITLFIFIRRVYLVYSIVRIGKGSFSDRFDRPLERIKVFLHHVLLQSRHIREPVGGIAHVLIFWGFIFYLLSYLNDPFLRGILPEYSILIIDSPYYLFILDLAGIVVLIGVILALYRRVVIRPPSLENKWDAWLTLALIVTVVSLNYVFNAAKIALNPIYPTPLVSGAIANLIPISIAELVYHVAWWIHTVSLFCFMIFIVYSKHLHMLLSPFSVLFTELRGNGYLERVELGEEEESYGAEKLNEFRWRDIFNAFVCAFCGRCDRACPAFNSYSVLSPRELIFKQFRKYAFTEGKKYLSGNKDVKSVFEYVPSENLWDCYLCLACTIRCPVYIEHYNLIIQMRRKLLEVGEIDPGIQEALTNFYRYGNSFGRPPRERPFWTKKLDFKIKDARKEKVEYLWYVGDYASYHPALQDITRITAKVFKALGLDFGILYEAEQNAGNDVRRIGEEGLFEILVEKNKSTLERAKFDKIITTDPHTYNALKNDYPSYGASYPVYHYVEILNKLIDPSKIVKKLNYKVTYHDPCYLGRYNGQYDAPRELLRKLGVEVLEMKRNRELSFCCGAGGGMIWKMEERKGKRPAVIRVEEAYNTGAELLVVACPKDYVMFVDAVKGAGLEGKLRVVDIAELVAEALGISHQ